jgi:PBP1b-binding outer membrane lipoprotein LpoB
MKKATWGNKLIVIFTILLFSTFFLSGCTSYYKVKDTQSGSVYYTTEVDRSGSGKVEFKDAKTGWDVTVLSSEVLEINEEEYKANTKKK